MGWRENRLITERLAGLEPGKEFRIRVNAGMGWIGKTVKDVRGKSGRLLTLLNPRPLHGVEKGISDMLGFDVVEITPDMVGQKVAVFVAEEVKATGDLSTEQRAFGDFVQKMGGIFKVLRRLD